MTRISLISVVYCSLETPARSAAPYAHQWHTKPNTLGLNLGPALICPHLFLYETFGFLESQMSSSSLIPAEAGIQSFNDLLDSRRSLPPRRRRREWRPGRLLAKPSRRPAAKLLL